MRKKPHKTLDSRFAAAVVSAMMILLFVGGCGGEQKADPGQRDSTSSLNQPTGDEQKNVASQIPYSDHQPVSAARFVEITPSSGVEFTYRNGEEAGHFSILESLGGGLALCDYDLDGDPDLFIPGGGTFGPGETVGGLKPALFRNDGAARFDRVTDPAGLAEEEFYSHGVAAADYDNDGFGDLLVTGYGGLLLYRNQGDGTFTEAATAAGLVDPLWSSSAAWGDLDADGDLDLYVVHYVNWSFGNHPHCRGPTPDLRDVCSPKNFEPLPDTVFFNNGDGTFRRADEQAGLRSDGKGLGVLIADVDLDGDLDIYVANDTVPNFLYRNDGTGRFEEIGLQSGTSRNEFGKPDGSMGVDLGDFNLDGLPDLWVANYERESFALYRNEGNCNFQHVSQPAGVTNVGGWYVGWGTVFFDLDRDGDEDLFASNGHVLRHTEGIPLRQPPLLFENHKGTRFENVASVAGEYTASAHMGRGVAAGDIDRDGDLDLAVSHTNEPVALLANETETAGGWIAFRLIGTRSSRDPVGALVKLQAGGKSQIRQLKSGSSYASSSEPILFFGLGEAESVETIEVTWPSGASQTLENQPANQITTLVEPPGP